MNFHLTIFHIYHCEIGKLQTHFLPKNQNKARTKLSNKIEKYIWTEKQNGPITSTFGPIRHLTNSSEKLKSVQIIVDIHLVFCFYLFWSSFRFLHSND